MDSRVSAVSEKVNADRDPNAPARKPVNIDITHELALRPRRRPNLLREADAFRELSELMLKSSQRAVERFVEIALELCDAGTAGLSLLPNTEGKPYFVWEKLAGALADSEGGQTPRDFSPCGLCLDAGHTILLLRPFELFEYFNAAAMPLMEGLIVPLYDTGGEPLGTIWVVHHDADKHFDAEDARTMEHLAIQLVLALKLRRERSEVRNIRRQVRALRNEKAGLIDESAFLNGVLASSSDCIEVLDTEGHVLFMSEGGLKVMEIDDFEAMEGRFWPDFWAEAWRHQAIAAIGDALEGGVGRFQAPAETARGNPLFLDVRVTAILGAENRPEHLLAIARDITEEHRSAAEREILGRELEHRVKNSLAMVSAIINQTCKFSETVQQAKETLLARVSALARTHDMLTLTKWQSARVPKVVEDALAPHRTGADRFEISGPDIVISAKQALSLTLALHELATNAAKYGALSNDDGRITLEWALSGGNSQNTFVLRWQESGGPEVSAPSRKGFGSRLIEELVPTDFGGEATLHYHPSGVMFELKSSGVSQTSRPLSNP